MAARLVAMHHDFDPQRFLALPNAATGYARFFSTELASPSVVLLIAVRASPTESDVPLGYAYAKLEPRSYNELLEACGKLHDVYVDPQARGHGVGAALVGDVTRRLAVLGAPRVVLLTATQNAAAQRMFARLGFRTTMLEMTRETDGAV